MDAIYSSEQIEIPPAFPAMLKAYAKEVIRNQPKDLAAFSRDYFAALAKGDVESFLEAQAKQQSAAKKPDAQKPAAAPAVTPAK